MNIQEIATLVGGQVKGSLELKINGVGSIQDAELGQITFLDSKKYLEVFGQCNASAVFVKEEIVTDKTQIVTANPKLAFAKMVAEFHPLEKPQPGVHAQACIGRQVELGHDAAILSNAFVDDNSKIGDRTIIASGARIGKGCILGADCYLHPNVVLYPGVKLGNRVILHAGAVIGADGFAYIPDEKGRHFKIHQIGTVVIEDDVEVGANTCIDRAAMGETRIKQGTKIDNLVQIGHNCTIGDHSIIVAQVGISGSCKLGKYAVLAGQVGLADHVNLGDHVTVAAKSGVFRSVESGQVFGGTPSIPLNVWKRYATLLPKLPRKIKDLEKRLQEIEKKFSKD